MNKLTTWWNALDKGTHKFIIVMLVFAALAITAWLIVDRNADGYTVHYDVLLGGPGFAVFVLLLIALALWLNKRNVGR